MNTMTRAQSRLKMALGATSVIALLVGIALFSAHDRLPPVVEWIGWICYFTWWIPLAIGVALGLLRRTPPTNT